MQKDEITISIKWLKHVVYFLVEAVVVFSIVIFGIHFFNSIPTVDMKPGVQYDPMAVANDFMVFVTFIVVVGTVAITIGGIFFTKEFSRDKKLVLQGNLEELKEEFLKNDEILNQFIVLLLKDQQTVEIIDKRLNELSVNRLEEIEYFKKDIIEQQKEELGKLEDRIDSKIRDLQSLDPEIHDIFQSFKDKK